MRFSLRVFGTALVALTVIGSAVSASAQDNSVSFGYQYQDLGDGGSIPMGFGADYSHALSTPLSIVGAVDFGRTTESASFGGVTADSTSSIITFAAGPRYTLASGGPKNAMFVQVLVGVGMLRASLSSNVGGINFSDTTSKLMVQPGFGAVHWLNDSWGVSGEIDYRSILTDGSSTNGVRLFLAARKKL